MTAFAQPVLDEPVPPKCPAYDPNNLHPADAEARLYDDTSDGIDWDEIIATTQDDFLAGRFAFNSADYPTWEAARAAMWALGYSILEKVLHDIAAERALDATGR